MRPYKHYRLSLLRALVERLDGSTDLGPALLASSQRFGLELRQFLGRRT